jgi:hypothetical protein
MPSVRQFGFPLFIAAALAAGACGAPPDKEMQQAQGAIDAARAAGANQYAHEEFAAAEDALKHAHEAVDERDYRLALNHALDSLERAQNAAREASDQKAKARSDAERAIADATAALNGTRAKLKAAETAHVTAKTLAAPRRVIADGDERLQKARAAFDRGDYLGAAGSVAGETPRLLAIARDLDAAARPAVKRRR